MTSNMAAGTITASMLLIGLTLFLSRGWAAGLTAFIEEKINNPAEPSAPSTPGASGESGFDPENAGSGQGAGGGGGSSW